MHRVRLRIELVALRGARSRDVGRPCSATQLAVHGLALDGRARQLSGRLDNVYAPAVSKATLMTTTLQPAFDTRAKLGAGLRKSTALAGLLVMAVACEDPVAMAPNTPSRVS